MRFLIRHRQAREASILHRLAKGEADIPTIVRAIYIGIDPRLMNAAGYSVLAHLEDLVARGIVATDGDPVIGGTYRLASWPEVIPNGAISEPGISRTDVLAHPLIASHRPMTSLTSSPPSAEPSAAQPAS